MNLGSVIPVCTFNPFDPNLCRSGHNSVFIALSIRQLTGGLGSGYGGEKRISSLTQEKNIKHSEGHGEIPKGDTDLHTLLMDGSFLAVVLTDWASKVTSVTYLVISDL